MCRVQVCFCVEPLRRILITNVNCKHTFFGIVEPVAGDSWAHGAGMHATPVIWTLAEGPEPVPALSPVKNLL